MTDPVYDKLKNCYDSIKDETPFEPKAALVLGFDLGDCVEQLEIQGTIDCRGVEEFPVSMVPGHRDRFMLTRMNRISAVLMQKRVHCYKGYSMSDVILSARPMKFMGTKTLSLINVAGRVNYDCEAGDFMLIKDQISCFIPSSFIGSDLEELGLGSPDVSHIYDEDLRDIVRSIAFELGIRIQEGVHIQFTEPAYEGPYEVKTCRILGGDAVGMSMVCEAVAVNHMGMKVCGISCISNLTCGMTNAPLSHQEVQEVSDRMALLFKKLVSGSIKETGSI